MVLKLKLYYINQEENFIKIQNVFDIGILSYQAYDFVDGKLHTKSSGR